jgi:hypothetical protein
MFQRVGVWISTELQRHTSHRIKGLVCGPNIVFFCALVQDAVRYRDYTAYVIMEYGAH